MKVGTIIEIKNSRHTPSLLGKKGVILEFTQTLAWNSEPKTVVHLFDDPLGKKHRFLKSHNIKKYDTPVYVRHMRQHNPSKEWGIPTKEIIKNLYCQACE